MSCRLLIVTKYALILINTTIVNVQDHCAQYHLYTAISRKNAFWFNGIGRWKKEEKVGYCYPNGLEKTLCKWDIHVPAAAHLLRSWVRIPPGWIFVCCECRVLWGRGLCDELITRPEESYRLCCVVVCDLETSRIGAPYIYVYDINSLRVNPLALKLNAWYELQKRAT
jgi:hypothetical protein